jgi:hypothetical protein
MKYELTKNADDYVHSNIDDKTVHLKGYDFFKIPLNVNLGDNSRDYSQEKKAYQLMYKLSINLQKLCSKKKFVKILIMISEETEDSQVIVFLDSNVYINWFKRNTAEIKWKKGNKKNPLLEALKINEYLELKESNYTETYYDMEISNESKTTNIWFYE